MEARISKKEQLQIFERRSARERQQLEGRQRRLEEKQRQIQQERHQLEQEWRRFNEKYEAGQKFINELWAKADDETGSEVPETLLEDAQSARKLQRDGAPSSNGTRIGSINEEVLIIVDEWQDDSFITQTEVRRKFLEKHPNREYSSLTSSISHFLSQLASDENGELELVEKGAGSRPAKYRKKVRREDAENLSP